jgi:hypothetical protein
MKQPRLTKYLDYEKVVILPVWSNYQVHVIFCSNIRETCLKRFNQVSKSPDADAVHVVSNKYSGHSFLIFKIGNASAGTIAHEVYHAVDQLLDYNGVHSNYDGEVVAYHVGYLVDEACSFRNRLIDAGIGVPVLKGVKSKRKQVNRNDKNGSTQGSDALVPTVQPGVQTEAGASGTATQATSNSGRCCP